MVRNPTKNACAVPGLVILIENSPLAARYLESILSHRARTLTEYAILSARSGLTPNKTSIIVDTGTLRTPLARYLRSLRFRLPEIKLCLLGSRPSLDDLCRLLFLGIEGFVSYDKVEGQLDSALSAISAGRIWVPRRVLDKFIQLSNGLTGRKGISPAILTQREKSIVELLRVGKSSNKEISSSLGMSESTVKFHLAKIFEKFGVHDRRLVVDTVKSIQPNIDSFDLSQVPAKVDIGSRSD